MVYETRQRRLRYVAMGIITILVLAILVISSLEFSWHIKEENQIEEGTNPGHSTDYSQMLKHLATFQYAFELTFFGTAFGALIYLYKRLTECFTKSEAHVREI